MGFRRQPPNPPAPQEGAGQETHGAEIVAVGLITRDLESIRVKYSLAAPKRPHALACLAKKTTVAGGMRFKRA